MARGNVDILHCLDFVKPLSSAKDPSLSTKSQSRATCRYRTNVEGWIAMNSQSAIDHAIHRLREEIRKLKNEHREDLQSAAYINRTREEKEEDNRRRNRIAQLRAELALLLNAKSNP